MSFIQSVSFGWMLSPAEVCPHLTHPKPVILDRTPTRRSHAGGGHRGGTLSDCPCSNSWCGQPACCRTETWCSGRSSTHLLASTVHEQNEFFHVLVCPKSVFQSILYWHLIQWHVILSVGQTLFIVRKVTVDLALDNIRVDELDRVSLGDSLDLALPKLFHLRGVGIPKLWCS